MTEPLEFFRDLVLVRTRLIAGPMLRHFDRNYLLLTVSMLVIPSAYVLKRDGYFK